VSELRTTALHRGMAGVVGSDYSFFVFSPFVLSVVDSRSFAHQFVAITAYCAIGHYRLFRLRLRASVSGR